MIPESLSLSDFVRIAEQIEEQNSIGFITNTGVATLGFASLVFN